MKALLIPVKDAGNAKTRLASVLPAEARRLLSQAMLEDVALAALSASTPDIVVVLSSFQPAIDFAKRTGAEVMVESSQESESTSVDWASRRLMKQGFDTVMRLPADVPLVTAKDIDSLLCLELNTRGVVLVPSRNLTGTNAIIRKPPNLFQSCFGPNSLEHHQREASKLGVFCQLITNERIAVDIDEPADLKVLLQVGAGTNSFRVAGELTKDGPFARIFTELRSR